MAGPMVQGAWVTKCNACGTCYTLPRFPLSNYTEGQSLVRPNEFDAQPLPCFCGHTFGADRDSLVYVILAILAIRRLSPDEFQVERAVAEIAAMWNLSKDAIRRMFQDESGVLVLGGHSSSRKRRYKTLRIPQSVLEKVYRRCSLVSY
jgi:hypothetical protein